MANITFSQFTKWGFILWFKILSQKIDQKKKRMIPSWEKKTDEKQNSATIMIFVDGQRDRFSSEVEIKRGIV